MDKQVENLLQEERKVNLLVKAALQKKREKMAEIQQHTENAVQQERIDLQQELNEKIAQVSQIIFFNL